LLVLFGLLASLGGLPPSLELLALQYLAAASVAELDKLPGQLFVLLFENISLQKPISKIRNSKTKSNLQVVQI
jgi:hypothetical protein